MRGFPGPMSVIVPVFAFDTAATAACRIVYNPDRGCCRTALTVVRKSHLHVLRQSDVGIRIADNLHVTNGLLTNKVLVNNG